ncbi:hypothetical protein D3C84_1031500 [compost metagenome]
MKRDIASAMAVVSNVLEMNDDLIDWFFALASIGRVIVATVDGIKRMAAYS